MISLNTVIQQVFPSVTQSPKGQVTGVVVGEEIWIAYEAVRPDGSYDDAITWKLVISDVVVTDSTEDSDAADAS